MTNEGRFLVEVDGVPSVRAASVSGLRLDHTVTEIGEGNRPNAHLVRGNYSVDDVTIKHGHAIPGAENAAQDIFDWVKGVARGGQPVERRTLRVVLLDEAGIRPIRTYELRRCLPRTFSEDDHNALGNNAATFTFSVKPEDMQVY